MGSFENVMSELAVFYQTKKLQDELLEICGQQIMYVLHYCKNEGIPVPNEKELRRLVDRTHEILEKLNSSNLHLTPNKNNLEDNSTLKQ